MRVHDLISTSIIFIIITISPIEEVSSLTIYPDIIYVDDNNINGPWDGSIEHPYRFIQQAIDHSKDGDIIKVLPGRYKEEIVINKQIYLIGADKNNTILDGIYNSSIIYIKTDNVDIYNFTIKNSGGGLKDTCISISANNINIYNCLFYNSRRGIICKGGGIFFSHCTFYKNGEGLYLSTSKKISIENCSFIKNALAVNIENTENIKVSNSFFSLNGISIQGCHIQKLVVEECILTDNSVNRGGIILLNSKDAYISNSRLIHNGIGISISSSNNISITYCTLSKNTHYAIIIRKPSSNISILNSIISNNLRCGIYIEKNNYCLILHNNIVGNKLYGICLYNSICNARYNWWGSPLGPRFISFSTTNIIKNHMGKVYIVPWSKKPLPNVGINNITDVFIDTPGIIENYSISFNETDSDNDGVPDWWEEKWGYNPYVWDDHRHLDPDDDGLNNIEECYTDIYGSNPFHKDIFLEIDWMESHSNLSNKPPLDFLNQIIDVFNSHNITLHIDIGELGGGEEISDVSICSNSYSTILYIYWEYFLHENPLNPRKGIFHYGVICNYCPDVNFPFIGWDNLDSFAISIRWLHSIYPHIPRGKLIAGAIIHHLGHTLGLIADTYDGIDNLGTLQIFSIPWWNYINYKSCMNYFYKFKVLSFSDGTHGRGDFNDWENMDLKFFKNSDFKR